MLETARLDVSGRIQMLARIRKELGLVPEPEILIRVEDVGAWLETRAAALRRAQEYMKQFKKPDDSIVEEFLAEHREEARLEREDLDR